MLISFESIPPYDGHRQTDGRTRHLSLSCALALLSMTKQD